MSSWSGPAGPFSTSKGEALFAFTIPLANLPAPGGESNIVVAINTDVGGSGGTVYMTAPLSFGDTFWSH